MNESRCMRCARGERRRYRLFFILIIVHATCRIMKELMKMNKELIFFLNTNCRHKNISRPRTTQLPIPHSPLPFKYKIVIREEDVNVTAKIKLLRFFKNRN